MLCARITPIVHGLDEEYGDKLETEVVSHVLESSMERIVEYELDVHGMALTDENGKLLWTESGHEQTKERVKEAIDAALGG